MEPVEITRVLRDTRCDCSGPKAPKLGVVVYWAIVEQLKEGLNGYSPQEWLGR